MPYLTLAEFEGDPRLLTARLRAIGLQVSTPLELPTHHFHIVAPPGGAFRQYKYAPRITREQQEPESLAAPCRHALWILAAAAHDLDSPYVGIQRPTGAWGKRLMYPDWGCTCPGPYTYDDIRTLAGIERPPDSNASGPPEVAEVFIGWRAYHLNPTIQDVRTSGALLRGGAGNAWSGATFEAVCSGECGIANRLEEDVGGTPACPLWLFDGNPQIQQIRNPEPATMHLIDDPHTLCEYHLSHARQEPNADSCGVYMFASLAEMFEQGYAGYGYGYDDGQVIAQAIGYGIVVPFARGWRASTVRMETMWILCQDTVTAGDTLIANMLSGLYDTPCHVITRSAMREMIEQDRLHREKGEAL